MLHENKSDDENLPMTGRLTPIGGYSSDTEYERSFNKEKNVLIEEHEKLNTSLAALTRHFAHVQLRLQQVVSAPTTEDRENLLFQLHEFASNGIPDVMCQSSMFLVETEISREKEFINDLKQKLDELEHYAAASGSLEGAPTLVTMEKQRVLIDELRKKLDLQLDDAAVAKLSAEELRKLVDQAIYQLTNPVKLKENLITQMRTQIGDLEKFIEFLRADSANTFIPSKPIETTKSKSTTSNVPQTTNSFSSRSQPEHNSSSIVQILKNFLVLTQLYTFLLLTCGTSSMRKNSNQPKTDLDVKRHFGDQRAKLEIAIEEVLHTVRSIELLSTDIDDSNENEEYSSTAIILAVRQVLAPALRALLEHGLYNMHYSTSLAIWKYCSRSDNNYLTIGEQMHIWKLFLLYYEMKQGHDYVNSPARQLSQSFSLDVIGGQPITIKHYILNGIDMVGKLHEKHTKPMDSCFKSFVCYALNEKKLVSFLRLILKTTSLIENYYQPWSYTKQTGFNDALHSLDRLTSIDFNLSINSSVRRFMNNQDLIE